MQREHNFMDDLKVWYRCDLYPCKCDAYRRAYISKITGKEMV